jgi:chorismate-pyruvate lyase
MSIMPFQGKCWHCGHDHSQTDLIELASNHFEVESLRTQLASAQAENKELVSRCADICDVLDNQKNTYDYRAAARYCKERILTLIKDNRGKQT